MKANRSAVQPSEHTPPETSRWIRYPHPPVAAACLCLTALLLFVPEALVAAVKTVPHLPLASPVTDGDHDGMPTDWEVTYNLDPGNRADAAGDPDGDGFSNLEEYLADTLPRDTGSALRITGVTMAAGNCTVTCATRPGVYYTAQTKSAMSDPAWIDLGLPAVAVGSTVSWTVPAQSPQRFYRIRASRGANGSPAYSLNTIGYRNIALIPGQNLVTNSLSVGNNRLDQVIPVAPDGAMVLTEDLDLAFYFEGAGWDSPDLILAPGASFVFLNPLDSVLVLTLLGEPLDGELGTPTGLSGQLQVGVRGVTGARYMVESTTDWALWTPVVTNSAPFVLTAPFPSTSGHQFFRVVSVP